MKQRPTPGKNGGVSVGDRVTAEWTWGHQRFQAAGEVAKVSGKTVKVKLTEDAGGHFKPGFIVTTSTEHVHKSGGTQEARRYPKPSPPPRRFVSPRAKEGHRVADFNTLDDLAQHARGEGATHIMHIDDEVHLYFRRSDGMYEKAEVWQKDGYWHTQAPGSRAVVQKPPQGAKAIGGRSVGEARRGGRIEKITRAYVRYYADNEEETAYVEWIDSSGKTGRTEGDPNNTHMKALLSRAEREGVPVERQTWGQASEARAPSPSHRRTARGAESRGERLPYYRYNQHVSGALRKLGLSYYRDLAIGYDDIIRAGWSNGTSEQEVARQIAALESAPGPYPTYVKEALGNTGEGAESRGEQYAYDQLQGDYFMNWVREQLAEAAQMPPEDVLPLETKQDATVIARNMLRDLEQDAKRDLQEDAAFWSGFRKALDGSRGWLADELLQIRGEMGGGHRVRDYIAIDRRDKIVGGPFRDYSDARREADAAGGVVKFVPKGKPVKEAGRR